MRLTAGEKGSKGAAEGLAVDGGEMESFFRRKDLMIGKTLAVDLALSDTGGRESVLISTFDKVDNDGVERFQAFLVAEVINLIDSGSGFCRGNNGVEVERGGSRFKRII